MRESKVQASIIRKLKQAGWMVNKIIQTSLNGWPDIEAFKDGVVVFIECKIPGRKPEPLQLYRHRQLREKGFKVIVAEHLKDVEELL